MMPTSGKANTKYPSARCRRPLSTSRCGAVAYKNAFPKDPREQRVFPEPLIGALSAAVNFRIPRSSYRGSEPPSPVRPDPQTVFLAPLGDPNRSHCPPRGLCLTFPREILSGRTQGAQPLQGRCRSPASRHSASSGIILAGTCVTRC